MGAERKSMLLTEKKARYGVPRSRHALVSILREHSDPIHKVTIIPPAWLLASRYSCPVTAQLHSRISRS